MQERDKNVILAVDDTEENLSGLGSILTSSGYTVALASNGTEAIETLQELSPDLILLDIMMPGIDGYEVCKRIKGDPKTKDIPVIFLTAKIETEDLVQAFNLGAVDYVTKPFRKEELLSRIKTHVHLRNTERELREIIKMRDKLFSIIGHDLRGSIGTFMMAMESITNKKFNRSEEEMTDYLMRMKTLSKNAYSLLENLLNWARSQQKLVKLEPTYNNLKNVIDEDIKLLNETANSKSIQLVIDVDEDLTAYFDKNSISTVFRNLVSNSLKFTNPDGKINISCSEIENYIKVSIEDSGIGITPENIEKLFKKDQIFSTGGTKGELGTGLGLLLCKDFVEGNGGTIWVESEMGKGSNFIFTIPKFPET